MSQISLPKDAPPPEPPSKQKDGLNTIVTDQSEFATIQQQNGFFSENIKQIFKQKHSIQRTLDQLNKGLFLPNKEKDSCNKLRKFIASLPPIADLDNSFEVRWSLSELENIVYDFINRHDLPKEFHEPVPGSPLKFQKDVCKEDLMKVVKFDKDAIEEPLPLIVRDYILHDRGNSLFLGNSFGNLPSPVAESATIKRLFKFNEDEKAEKPN